jgi:hypothetical protein
MGHNASFISVEINLRNWIYEYINKYFPLLSVIKVIIKFSLIEKVPEGKYRISYAEDRSSNGLL